MNSTLATQLPYELSEDAFFDEYCPETVRPAGRYMRSKFLLDNWSQYMKWLESKVESRKSYAITLTTDVTDPEKWPTVEQEMVNAISKIFTQQTCPVLEAEAYLEYQTSGAPHIHGYYRCDKGHRIYTKIFKRYWPLWNEAKKCGKGHQGGFHEVMKTDKYKGYMAAEGRKVYP